MSKKIVKSITAKIFAQFTQFTQNYSKLLKNLYKLI